MKHKTVGVIGDLHIPANHPGYLKFIKSTFKKFNVDTVVAVGDIVDSHAISRHLTEPDAMSGNAEAEAAVKELKKWTKAFPNVKCCLGNHDMIPARQLKTLGMPEIYLKSLNEMYGLPDGWEWAEQWEIDGVIYSHGLEAGAGQFGFKNAAINYGQSYVCGHTHSNLGVVYSCNGRRTIFGAAAGCGIDDKSYAFRYGKTFKNKSTLGCVVVFSPTQAIAIHMDK